MPPCRGWPQYVLLSPCSLVWTTSSIRGDAPARPAAASPAPITVRLLSIWILINQLQAELQLARRARAGNPPESTRIQIRARIAEVHPIEQIKRLRPKLKPDALGDRRGFKGREVKD